MRKHRKHFDDEAEVDMTPMLDIVFIMLIFFIVTTSFVKEDGIVLNRPNKNQQQPENPDPSKSPILVRITDTGDVYFGQRLIDLGSIRANVEAARAKKPNAAVVVEAHPDSESGKVVRAVDQAKLAGVEKVIVVKPAK